LKRLKAKLVAIAPEELEGSTVRHSLYAKPETVSHRDHTKKKAAMEDAQNDTKKTKPLLPPGEYSTIGHEPYENFEMLKQMTRN